MTTKQKINRLRTARAQIKTGSVRVSGTAPDGTPHTPATAVARIDARLAELTK